MSKGKLFATGLVAGGALAGVIIAIFSVKNLELLQNFSIGDKLTSGMGVSGYNVLGSLSFAGLAFLLYKIARQGKQ